MQSEISNYKVLLNSLKKNVFFRFFLYFDPWPWMAMHGRAKLKSMSRVFSLFGCVDCHLLRVRDGTKCPENGIPQHADLRTEIGLLLKMKINFFEKY